MLAAGSPRGLQQLQRRSWTLQLLHHLSVTKKKSQSVHLKSFCVCLQVFILGASCKFLTKTWSWWQSWCCHVVSNVNVTNLTGEILIYTRLFHQQQCIMEVLTSHIPISVMISGCAVLNGRLWSLQWSVWRSGCEVQGWAGAHENGSVGS